MPRYNYQCDECENIVIVFHGINEVAADCPTCEAQQTMKRLLSVPTIIKSEQSTQQEAQVGALTREYIEANRQILREQKKEAKKETYESS